MTENARCFAALSMTAMGFFVVATQSLKGEEAINITAGDKCTNAPLSASPPSAVSGSLYRNWGITKRAKRSMDLRTLSWLSPPK